MAEIKKYNRIKVELAEAVKKNQELAGYLNVHVTTVSDWCTNKNQPSVQDLYRISEFLRIDVRRLLSATNWESGLTKAAESEPVFKRTKKIKKKK
jgi:putative transcriptional regulator